MFKVIGGISIVFASYMVFNRKTFVYYSTYKFLHKIVSIIEKLEYEKNSNMAYDDIFKKMNFDWKQCIKDSEKNIYIVFKEIKMAADFFENLGKRDSLSEEKYIYHNIQNFTAQKNSYYKKYCEFQKIYAVCGISFGLLIIIFLI